MITSAGNLWRIIGNNATPVRFNTSVIPLTQNAQTLPTPRTIAASPNGEVALALAGNGFAYLYDAMLDDFVQSRQVVTGQITGYYGPISVGPRGQYFLVNGLALNQSLSPMATAGSVNPPAGGFPGGPGTLPGAIAGAAQVNRPVASVSQIGLSQYARFVPPVVANANALATLQDAGSIEIVDVATGFTMRSAPTLERPLNTPVGNARANIPGRLMAVDAASNLAYLVTASGLSMIPLDVVPPAQRPVPNNNGTVNLGNQTTQISPNGLISISGRNLAKPGTGGNATLPTILGGACVTMDNRPLPLIMTSPEQINAQIPPASTTGRHQIVIRGLDTKIASNPINITVSKYAPAVLVDPDTKQPGIYHGEDGKPVTKDDPAKRDRPLTLYAMGLGVPKGARIDPGVPSPSPAIATDKVQVFFGNPTIHGSEVIVDSSVLVPGIIGIYQLKLRVPGNHLRGESLPVTLRIGGVNSPVTGALAPLVAVD